VVLELFWEVDCQRAWKSRGARLGRDESIFEIECWLFDMSELVYTFRAD
jgi:hypothetical protein